MESDGEAKVDSEAKVDGEAKVEIDVEAKVDSEVKVDRKVKAKVDREVKAKVDREVLALEADRAARARAPRKPAESHRAPAWTGPPCRSHVTAVETTIRPRALALTVPRSRPRSVARKLVVG